MAAERSKESTEGARVVQRGLRTSAVKRFDGCLDDVDVIQQIMLAMVLLLLRSIYMYRMVALALVTSLPALRYQETGSNLFTWTPLSNARK